MAVLLAASTYTCRIASSDVPAQPVAPLGPRAAPESEPKPLPPALAAKVARFYKAFPNAKVGGPEKGAAYVKRYRIAETLDQWNKLGETYPYLAHRFKLLLFQDIGGSYQGETSNDGYPGSVRVRLSPNTTHGTRDEEWGHLVRHVLWFTEEKQRMLTYGRSRRWGSAAWGQAFRKHDKNFLKWLARYKTLELPPLPAAGQQAWDLRDLQALMVSRRELEVGGNYDTGRATDVVRLAAAAGAPGGDTLVCRRSDHSSHQERADLGRSGDVWSGSRLLLDHHVVGALGAPAAAISILEWTLVQEL